MGLDFIPTLALPLAHLVLLFHLRRHWDPSRAGQTASQIQASAIFTTSKGESGGSNYNGTGPGSSSFK